MTTLHIRSAGRRLSFGIAVYALATACNTDVNAPDVVTPSALDNAVGAQALRAGALNAFAGIYAADAGQITVSGTLADEFTTSHPLVFKALNGRATTGVGDENGLYQRLHAARLAAEVAATAVTASAAPGATGLAASRAQSSELLSLAGFTKLFLSETYCAGVSLSRVVDGATVYGEPLNTAQLLDSALASFDAALTLGADSARTANLARIGRARTLLQRGRQADAATAVNAVPTTYQYLVEYAAANSRQLNGIPSIINNQKQITVANREGATGLDFVTAADPRVATSSIGAGFDGVTIVYAPGLYPNNGSSAVLASGRQARLIEAEAALRGGNATSALGLLNALRSSATPALGSLADAGTDGARIDQLFRERAFWLFGTGQRLGDLRRLIRQYGRTAATTFPSGSYYLGGSYGSDVNVQIPQTELPNPRFVGCLNRNP